MPVLTKHHIRSPKFWLVLTALALTFLVSGVLVLRGWYQHNLNPVSASTRTTYFTVQKGASLHQIANGLKKASLIRSASAFEYYVRTNELYSRLQAGTYSLSQSMSVKEIVTKIVNGEIAQNLITILPGKRLEEIKKAFTDNGYSPAAISEAFNPKTYGGLAALSSLPADATLEGYLYPDSFQKNAETPATVIVQQSLNELDSKLTTDILDGIRSQGLSIYQAVILASIVYRETDDVKYQATVAQVLLSRLKNDMPLGADVTADYAADVAGVPRSVNLDSAYNTRLHAGLPPSPISNFTASALAAVARPANTDYLYFVAGDDGVIHFSHSQAEHEAAVAKYCQKKCLQ